eukprot:9676436-Heterocapsa_arctica.AAC.1
MQEYELKDFVEIANYVENGLMQRMIEEDEEDQGEVEEKGAGSSEGSKKYMMTQETVNIMVTMVTEDMMKK